MRSAALDRSWRMQMGNRCKKGLLVVCCLLSCLFTSCRFRPVYAHYEATDLNGWKAGQKLSFHIDSLSRGGQYAASLELRKAAAWAYPYENLSLEVRQKWVLPIVERTPADSASRIRALAKGLPAPRFRIRRHDSLLICRTDTLIMSLNADNGMIRSHGIAFYPYSLPISTVELPQGAVGEFTIRHIMRREDLPGIESVGILLQ